MSAALTMYLDQEASALLSRLDSVLPLARTMPMVTASSPGNEVLMAIELHLMKQKSVQRRRILGFRHWLKSAESGGVKSAVVQRQFSVLKLQFNAVLDQLDIFADVLTQRGEHEHGIWMSALDYAAKDALYKPGQYYTPLPMACYLERGHGAAIRRARTRLPGGVQNPVSIVRVPRERMVGGGIASSLFHEVGHQGAALLNLVEEFGRYLQANRGQGAAWDFWIRWRSEILADFWALSQLGVSATGGLISVVTLPRPFVFRISMDAPHPFPWMRVQISCYLGAQLFPDAQWQRVRERWETLYPLSSVNAQERDIVQALLDSLPEFARLLLAFKPAGLRGKPLIGLFPLKERQPARLRQYLQAWKANPVQMYRRPPGEVFAVLGQAREDGKLGAMNEAELLKRLFSHWAMENSGIGTADAVTKS